MIFSSHRLPSLFAALLFFFWMAGCSSGYSTLVNQPLALHPDGESELLRAPLTEEQIATVWNDSVVAFWERGETFWMTTADSLRLAWRHYAPTLAPRAEVVVFQGRTEGMLKYDEIAYELVRQGFGVWLLDHRGQGWSDRMTADPEAGWVASFDDYIDDAHRFVLHHVAPAAQAPLVLLTHSMGGTIGAGVMTREPKLFTAAAMIAPMVQFDVVWLGPTISCAFIGLGSSQNYIISGGPWQEKQFEKNPYTTSQKRFDRWMGQWLADSTVRIGSPTYGWVKAACDAGEQMLAEAEKIETPLLIFQGGEDRIVVNSAQLSYCGAVVESGGSCRVVAFPDARHELLIERDEVRLPLLEETVQFFLSPPSR